METVRRRRAGNVSAGAAAVARSDDRAEFGTWLHRIAANCAGNAKLLVEIARKETNPELKRAAISALSSSRSKEAADYLMEILNK